MHFSSFLEGCLIVKSVLISRWSVIVWYSSLGNLICAIEIDRNDQGELLNVDSSFISFIVFLVFKLKTEYLSSRCLGEQHIGSHVLLLCLPYCCAFLFGIC